MITVKQPFISMFFKLFLSFLLISLLIFMGLLYSSLTSSKEALIRQKSEDMSLFTERTGQYLDLYLQNIRNILLNVSRSIEETTLSDPQKVQSSLKYYTDSNSALISQLYIRSSDGTIFSSNQVLMDVVGHPQLGRIFRFAYENPGLINWSEPYFSPILADKTIAFVLALKDQNGTQIGVALAEINIMQLTQQFRELLSSRGQSFALFTSKGNVISFDRNSNMIPYKEGSLQSEMDGQFVSDLLHLPNGVGRLQGTSGSLMAVKSNQNQLGWSLILLTDERVFRKSVIELYKQYIWIGVIWFSLLLFSAYWISRHFTRPIKLLALQMDRVRGGRISAHVKPVVRNDEIGRLSNSFYMMLTRIEELVETIRENEERKKATQLKLLLSQIRPHFLYNTLACIGSLAKQHKVNDVEETIRSLIIMLSFSIDKKDDIVTIEEELECLKAYVQIQKIRYGDTFDFIVQVNDNHFKLLVPKLILQPLVENSIFHGVAKKGKGVIGIRSFEQDGLLGLTVWDDGEGFSAERLHSILNLSTSDEIRAKSSRPQGLNSIGLANVQERIKLNYGKEYGLQIRSEPGILTEIELKIPLLK